MTSNRTSPADRIAPGESKASLFGAALMVVIALVVIGTAVALGFAAIALGDTAFDLP